MSSPGTGFTPQRARRTAVLFSASELTELGQLLAVGQAVLQQQPAVLARLKAAMTRLGVRPPKGL